MKFDYIKIIEGMYQRIIVFDEYINLIFSKKNSQGKTTLLRLLMYSLGYKIPNTKAIKFENCFVETKVTINTKNYVLTRQGDYIEVKDENGLKHEFVLQDEQDSLHSFLFGTKNTDILHNLLGCFYVDQEKGWTLLNRGVVIGSNRFNVAELLRGLTDRDCSNLKKEIRQIETELSKYKKMLDISEYRQQLYEEQGSLIYENYDDANQKELDNLYLQKSVYEKELKNLKSAYNDNQSFKKYIEKMKLYVVSEDGKEIPVNSKTIKNFNETVDLLRARQKIIAAEISAINRRIEKLDTIVEKEQISFNTTNDIIKDFDKKISSFDIDYTGIQELITALEKKRKLLKAELTIKTKQNNDVLISMYHNIEAYAKELSLEKYINLRTDFIFTHNLKELSGAILHKIVFSFKLGFIIEAEKYLGFKLPIILDSPSGKEIDPKNVEKMMEILQRDFKDNQIIIASIHDYSIIEKKKIHTIEDRLINEPIS